MFVCTAVWDSRTLFVFLTLSTCPLVCSSLSSLSFSVIIRQELVLATLPKEQFTVCRCVLMMRVGSATHHQHWAAQCEEQVSVYCWPEIAPHTYLETKRKIIFTEQFWRKIFDKDECLQRGASKPHNRAINCKMFIVFYMIMFVESWCWREVCGASARPSPVDTERCSAHAPSELHLVWASREQCRYTPPPSSIIQHQPRTVPESSMLYGF